MHVRTPLTCKSGHFMWSRGCLYSREVPLYTLSCYNYVISVFVAVVFFIDVVAGKVTANCSPSKSSQSSDELSVALSNLKLNSQCMTKEIIKAEPATKLCDDAQQHGITSVPLMDHLKASTESIDTYSKTEARDKLNSECIDVDEIPSLAERLKGHKSLSTCTSCAEQKQAKSIRNTECIGSCEEIPSLGEKARPSQASTCNKANLTYTALVLSSQHVHVRADLGLNCVRTQKTSKKSSNTFGQLRTGRERQIVISDSSSESEAEDPLMPCRDTKVGGAQLGMTSSLHYQYCDSSLSEDGSSSDDDVPPLASRIGSKRSGTSSSPLKSKLSPTKDLVMKSKTETAQLATKVVNNAKRKVGFETSKAGLSDDVGSRNCDVGEKDTCISKGTAYGTVGLSGTCCIIGSAESPIVID